MEKDNKTSNDEIINSSHPSRKKESNGFFDIFKGLFFLIVGWIASASSHQSAVRRNGGSYTIWWGAIVFGVILIIIGIVKISQNNRRK